MYPFPRHNSACPIHALPDLLYDAAFEVHSLDDDIPTEALLTDVIALGAAVVHQRHDVRGLDERTMPTTINTLAVISSGFGKGTSYRALFRPLRNPRQSTDAGTQRHPHNVFYTSFHGQPPQEAAVVAPNGPRDASEEYIMQDISFRALMDVLNGNHRSTTIQHEDGWGFLQSDIFVRHPDKLSQFWSGEELIRHKVHRVDLLALDARCSLGFRIQPELFYPYLRRTGGISYLQGLWPRCIAAYYDPARKSSFPNRAPSSSKGLERLGERLQFLLGQIAEHWASGATTRAIVDLDQKAVAFMMELKFHLKTWQQREYADVRAAAARAWENTLRLAAVFHIVCGDEGSISLDMVERAWAIVEWSLTQHRRILAEVNQPKAKDVQAAPRKADRNKAPRPNQSAQSLKACIEEVCRHRNEQWILISDIEVLTDLPPLKLTKAWAWLKFKKEILLRGVGARAMVSINLYSRHGSL